MSQADELVTRASIGAEWQLNDQLWFNLAIGGSGGGTAEDNQVFIKGSFDFGFTREASISPVPE